MLADINFLALVITHGLVTMMIRTYIIVNNSVNGQIRMQGTTKVGVLSVHDEPSSVGLPIFCLRPVRKPFGILVNTS